MNLSNAFAGKDELEYYGRHYAADPQYVEHYKAYRTTVLNNYFVLIHETDSGLMPHIRDGYWESWIMLWILRNVKPRSSTADLGANVGFYTFLLDNLECSVDAFEPNPFIFNLLQAGWLDIGSPEAVTLKNSAVGAIDGEIDFIVPRNNYMNGSFHSSVYSPDGEDTIKVKVESSLDPYDFIKIDVEGAEHEIFEILKPTNHPLVLMEFRWDRYSDPLEFAKSIFEKYANVAYVEEDGSESELHTPGELKGREHSDWMLVLRA